MKVLHVYRTYYPDSQGGLEEVIRQCCLNPAVESRVFTVSETASPEAVMVDQSLVVRCKKHLDIASNSISLTGFAAFRRQVEWADVIHYHFPWPFGDLLHLWLRSKKPCLVTYHSDIVRQKLLLRFYSPLMYGFLNRVDRVVATSPNYFASSDVLSKIKTPVSVIPIGIDETSNPAADTATIAYTRAKYGEDFFLFVGVLRYYKGLHILLDAIQNAPFQVVIVGSGPTETELRAHAKRLGLTNVRFTGHVPDAEKMALYQLSKAVVFPSYLRSEAFGVTLLEGAMSERALISTEVGTGTSHVNVDGETGLVVTPACTEALREAMDELHNNPERCAELGRGARRRYEALFTGALMGERYTALYHELVKT